MQKDTSDPGRAPTPSFHEALGVWARIGLLSFGGPVGQIALMHKVLIDERRWIDEPRFLAGLNFCMLLPGPEAIQLATYIGWRMHGLKGGLAAGLLFLAPGALVVLALSMLYAAFGQVPIAEALFTGIKAAVLAIVVEALLKVSRRALKLPSDWAIAAAAFVAIFALGVPFPLIVLTAALVGYVRASSDRPADSAPPPVSTGETLRTVGIWLAIWIVPLVAIAAVFGFDSVLAKLAWFFSKLAVVSFGGAYAGLAYMAQVVVERFGWLAPGEMLDGLGLAETTPGPLILVTEFVGFLAAFRGGGNPYLMGTLGALVTLWATFAPCFLWIFAGAPYVEWLSAAPKLKSALAGVTAAVVGVILNLSVWFALHVVFAKVEPVTAGPVHVALPHLDTVRWDVAVLAALATVMIFVLHRGIITTLAVCGALSLIWHRML